MNTAADAGPPCASITHPAVPHPIVIDTDPGTDDAVALWLALAAPDRLAIEAITVTGGNVGLERCLRNALAIAGLAGSTVPVHPGADRPLLGTRPDAAHVHGADGLGAVALPPGGVSAPEPAADAIRAVLRRATRPVTLVGLGPATNLALALATEPALTPRVDRIVLMSGAVGPGNITPWAEFNAAGDPEALAMLLDAGPPVVFATLDLTEQARASAPRLASLRAGGNNRCLDAACRLIASVPAERDGPGPAIHDACAIAFLVAPALFTERRCRVAVDLAGPTRGRTALVNGTPNAVLLETIDADGFFSLLGARLASLP